MTKWLLVALILLILAANDVSGTVALADSFSPTANNMNVARYLDTATLLPNGTVLIVGGIDSTDDVLASTELYDPATTSFTAVALTATMNFARFDATASPLSNGTILIAGGGGMLTAPAFSVSEDPLASTELFDSKTNSFAPSVATATMNVARVDAIASLLTDGKVLIAGGIGVDSILSSSELYDPATNSFAPPGSTATMNVARFFATATLLPNGKVLIAGGTDGFNDLASTELYDPATNSFAPPGSTATMITGRAGHTATLLPNGLVLIAGGISNNVFLASTEIYDPVSNSFSPGASMDTPHDVHTATLLTNGHVLIAGGAGTGMVPLASSEIYDPSPNSFSPASSMGAARFLHTATKLGNGQVLIAGGQGAGFVALSSAELYSAGFLEFPVEGSSPWTAQIISVFDHSMSVPYGPANRAGYGVVTAFTGETASGANDGCPTGKQKDLYGYSCATTPGATFVVNGNGSYAGVSACGGSAYLEYDNHPGYDYAFTYGTPLYPAVSGTVHYDVAAAGASPASRYHTLEIDPDGMPYYRVLYLHLSTYPHAGDILRCYDPNDLSYSCGYNTKKHSCTSDKLCTAQVCLTCPLDRAHVDVNNTQPIAYSGNFLGTWGGVGAHFHFEVDKCVSNCGIKGREKWIPVDPYGWNALSGKPDPYDSLQGLNGVNIPLWSQPSPATPASFPCDPAATP